MTPKRSQQKRAKGWKMPPNTVSVARPSKWGNPYSLDEFGRDKAVALYREYLTSGKGKKLPVGALRGKNLACFCAPGLPCHAEVLLELANRETAGNVSASTHGSRHSPEKKQFDSPLDRE
jgi:hypothetical protein